MAYRTLRSDGAILIAVPPPSALKCTPASASKTYRAVTIRYSAFLNRGEPFQIDMVTTFAVGERNTIAGLGRGVGCCG